MHALHQNNGHSLFLFQTRLGQLFVPLALAVLISTLTVSENRVLLTLPPQSSLTSPHKHTTLLTLLSQGSPALVGRSTDAAAGKPTAAICSAASVLPNAGHQHLHHSGCNPCGHDTLLCPACGTRAQVVCLQPTPL